MCWKLCYLQNQLKSDVSDPLKCRAQSNCIGWIVLTHPMGWFVIFFWEQFGNTIPLHVVYVMTPPCLGCGFDVCKPDICSEYQPAIVTPMTCTSEVKRHEWLFQSKPLCPHTHYLPLCNFSTVFCLIPSSSTHHLESAVSNCLVLFLKCSWYFRHSPRFLCQML